MAIDSACGIIIATDGYSIQSDPGERAFCARVGEDLSLHLPISVSRGMTPYRTRGSRSVRADLELAGDQSLHAFFILDDHDQVNAFQSDLKACAAAADGEERRGAPSVLSLAGGHAFAMAATQNESAFQHIGYHGNAFRVFKDFLGNALVRGSHDVVHDLR